MLATWLEEMEDNNRVFGGIWVRNHYLVPSMTQWSYDAKHSWL